MLTIEKLETTFNAQGTVFKKYLIPLQDTFDKYEINTTLRKAAFLAQVGYESALFHSLVENLNYSGVGLQKTFPKYFNKYNVFEYANKPDKIANRVYADRLGNGNEASGDGWKFRGRGLIQLTGRDNYIKCATGMDKTVDILIPYIQTPEGACMSAGWFWNHNGLNSLADRGDFVGITEHINGGHLGLATRTKYYNNGKTCL